MADHRLKLESENESLRQHNARLLSNIQELRTELSYFAATNKQMAIERALLKENVTRLTKLYEEVAHRQAGGQKIEDVDYMDLLVNYPAKSIAEIITSCRGEPMTLTTAQAPFYIEYINKEWAHLCGWESHEVLGLTFGFMQGKNTDMRTTASFMTDIKAFGYARMSVINYRKDGQAFSATVTVRPIFDSICSVGVDANVPILTHFATTIADFTELEDGDPAPLPRTENLFSNDGYYRQAQTAESSGQGGGGGAASSRRRGEHDDDTLMAYEGSDDGAEAARSAGGMPVFDARVQSKKVTTASVMTAQDFIKYAAHLRLSDLCRLMVTCHNPIVLTDASGGILHVSEPWVALTGYNLSEVEGYTCGFLQGPETDREQVARCMADVRALRLGQMQVINYKKDGTAFNTTVIIHPLRGAYLSSEISHYFAMLIPE